MNRPVQYFTDDYLAQSQKMSTDQICQFLENFRLLTLAPKLKSKRKLISMKVPVPLLESFRTKAAANGIPYQTQIQNLMNDWVKSTGSS